MHHQVVCQHLQFSPEVSERQLLHGIAQAAKVYYNYTGDASCLNISQSATGNLGMMGWFYQVRLKMSSVAGCQTRPSLWCARCDCN